VISKFFSTVQSAVLRSRVVCLSVENLGN